MYIFSNDKSEFRQWYSHNDGLNYSPNDLTTREPNRNDYTTTSSQNDRYNYNGSYYNTSEPKVDKYSSYGSTSTHDWANATVFHTSSDEETNELLKKLGGDVFIDPNPQVVRHLISQEPVELKQRVFVKYLQPPSVPRPDVMR